VHLKNYGNYTDINAILFAINKMKIKQWKLERCNSLELTGDVEE
jgi:hypothetical protein